MLSIVPVGKAYSIESEPWKFNLVFPMIWVVDINGDINIGENSIDINTSFQDTLNSLSFGYMVEFYARKGRWRYAVKLNYEESENDTITTGYILPPGIPVIPSHKLETETVQGTTDATIGYEFRSNLLLFTGVRYIFSEIDLKITPQGSGIIEVEEEIKVADENLYDWLVGAEYQHRFGPKWILILNADVAIAGDNDTDYSANAIFAYTVSKLNTVWIGYRYLRIADEFEEEDVKIKTDFVTHGPTVGWAFTF